MSALEYVEVGAGAEVSVRGVAGLLPLILSHQLPYHILKIQL